MDLNDAQLILERPTDEVLAVNDALDKLALEDPLAAELVKLRYFVGMSLPEAAQTLGIAPRTADRLWAYARTWLRVELESGTPR